MSTILVGNKRRNLKTPLKISFQEDPFFSRSNIEYLEKVTSEIDSGTAQLEEHELIEI